MDSPGVEPGASGTRSKNMLRPAAYNKVEVVLVSKTFKTSPLADTKKHFIILH